MQTRIYEFEAAYFDGKSAVRHAAKIRLTPHGLILTIAQHSARTWPYASIRLNHSGGARDPVRLERPLGSDSSVETLVIEDARFLEQAHDIAPGALVPFLHRARNKVLSRFLLLMALLFIPPFLYVVWTVGIPAMTDSVAENVPVAWEEKLGETVLKTMIHSSLPEPDPEMKQVLDEISGQLLQAFPNQPYAFKIYVHPGKMVNAMALPGGTIVVFQGLINITATPEELAGVLAHEFQHVLLRHSTRGIIRQLATSALLAILVGDSNGVMNSVLGAAGQLESLHFSRSMETEADQGGMKMILAAGIDPAGMVRIFEKLQQEERRLLADFANATGDAELGEKIPEWMKYLSTHPAGADRVALLQELSRASARQPQPLLPKLDWQSMYREPEKIKN